MRGRFWLGSPLTTELYSPLFLFSLLGPPHINWEGKKEERYIREIIYGRKREVEYWEITTDKEKEPSKSTWFVMTRIANLNYKQVGEIYKNRGWIEYGFKQSKSELGWADYRVTDYAAIRR